MPRRAEAADHRHDVADFGRIEPGQHLVEQQQLRLGRQRAGKLEPLAPGDGQRVGRPVEHVGQADLAADLLGDGERRLARAMAQMRADQDVLAHRQAGEGLHDLEGAGDAAPREPMRRLAGDVLAGDSGPLPSLALRKPEMMANSVVLPAPFGPISAVMRPFGRDERRGIHRQQAAEAARDALDRRAEAQPWPASAPMLERRVEPLPRLREAADQAARREPDDQHQHRAVDDEVEAGRVAGDQLRALAQRLDHQRAEQRTEHRADAADDRREQRLDRDPGAVGDAGIDEQEILRVEAAGGGGDRAGDHHGGRLDRGGVDAERLRRVLVLAHRDQPGAEARALDQLARSPATTATSARMIQ